MDVRALMSPSYKGARAELTPQSVRSEGSIYDPNLATNLNISVSELIDINARLSEKTRSLMENSRAELEEALKKAAPRPSSPHSHLPLENEAEGIIRDLEKQLREAEARNKEEQEKHESQTQAAIEIMTAQIAEKESKINELSKALEDKSGDQLKIEQQLEEAKLQNTELKTQKTKLEKGTKAFIIQSDSEFNELHDKYKRLKQYKQQYIELKAVFDLAQNGVVKARQLNSDLLSPVRPRQSQGKDSGRHRSSSTPTSSGSAQRRSDELRRSALLNAARDGRNLEQDGAFVDGVSEQEFSSDVVTDVNRDLQVSEKRSDANSDSKMSGTVVPSGGGGGGGDAGLETGENTLTHGQASDTVERKDEGESSTSELDTVNELCKEKLGFTLNSLDHAEFTQKLAYGKSNGQIDKKQHPFNNNFTALKKDMGVNLSGTTVESLFEDTANLIDVLTQMKVAKIGNPFDNLKDGDLK